MLDIRFLLVGEGPFDNNLKRPLERLCISCGAGSAVGTAPDLRRIETGGRELIHQVASALELEPGTDILFIHRDADSPDPSNRIAEIRETIPLLDREKPSVAVVPVQATEAWALLSEKAIRRAADNPDGIIPLDIPSPSDVEQISNPKDYLNQLLVEASGHSGRKLDRFKENLHKKKRRIIKQLDTTGPITKVPAWQDLRERIESVLEDIRLQRY